MAAAGIPGVPYREPHHPHACLCYIWRCTAASHPTASSLRRAKTFGQFPLCCCIAITPWQPSPFPAITLTATIPVHTYGVPCRCAVGARKRPAAANRAYSTIRCNMARRLPGAAALPLQPRLTYLAIPVAFLFYVAGFRSSLYRLTHRPGSTPPPNASWQQPTWLVLPAALMPHNGAAVQLPTAAVLPPRFQHYHHCGQRCTVLT